MKPFSLFFIFALVFTFSCTDTEDKGEEKSLPDLLGPGTTIRISPHEVGREAVEDYTITIKLGEAGLPAGESIGLVNGSFIDRWKFSFASHWWG